VDNVLRSGELDDVRAGRMVLPSEIASIASAVSGLTATVSLIYVGIQIRLRCREAFPSSF